VTVALAIRSIALLAVTVTALSLGALSLNADERLPLEWAGPGLADAVPDPAAVEVAGN
jgi:hypothetical protein